MILDDIVFYRRQQLERERTAVSFEEIKRSAEKISAPCKGFKRALAADGLSIIAEVKKASPSKGVIQPDFRPSETAAAYEKAGAAAISCLTEEHYFMGSSAYLKSIGETVNIPILRKDFIIDPYQIYEARVIGADAILLIAAILSAEQMTEYRKIAESLDMDVLAESHNEEELKKVADSGCTVFGINNRDLKDFTVTLDTTKRLSELVPEGGIIVSESGIKTAEDMKFLADCGASAVLIGETLMRSGNIGEAVDMLRKGL